MSIEKTADPADLASQLEEQHHEQCRLAREHTERQRIATYQRLVAAGEHDPDFCMACGEDLPAERITDKRLRCTPCEDRKERSKG